jgi:hypothetical protein
VILIPTRRKNTLLVEVFIGNGKDDMATHPHDVEPVKKSRKRLSHML